MDDVDAKINAQMDRFRAELPALLATHAGQWVVYLDGVQFAAPDENTAYGWALDHYGIDGGFVVTQVVEQRPVLLTAAVAFSGHRR